MSILDLPPELLLEIFEYTIPSPPSLEHEDYFQRTRVLLSFALVHSQWTRVAQEILRREVWLGDTTFRDEQLERHCQQLMRKVEGGRTLYLSVDGDIEVLLRTTTLEWWRDLIYLRNRPMYHFRNSTGFETFAQFPNLKTLHLSMAIFSFDRSNLFLEPSFTKLRRLVFSSRPVIRGKIEAIQGLLSPTHMPNLTHLAIASPESASCGPAELFVHLLPQITTLALSDSVFDHSASHLFETIGRCSKLKHLSLSIEYDDLESLLFTNAAGLHLESLHISSSAFDDLTTLLPRLTVVAKGEPETIRVERVVLYEEEESLLASRPYMVDSEVFEWRNDRDAPPFEDFDGR